MDQNQNTTHGRTWWEYVTKHAPCPPPLTYGAVARLMGTSRQNVAYVVGGHWTVTLDWCVDALTTLAARGWPESEVVATTDGTMTIRARRLRRCR